MNQLPTPECSHGYTRNQLSQILKHHHKAFMTFHAGQGFTVCDEHGPVTFVHDVHNFLERVEAAAKNRQIRRIDSNNPNYAEKAVIDDVSVTMQEQDVTENIRFQAGVAKRTPEFQPDEDTEGELQ